MFRKLFYPLLIILASCGGVTKDQPASTTDKVKGVAKVKLKELDNQDIDLDQYKGKTIFINFWATWCKPCLQEMPSIERLQNQLKDDNIIFLFASNEELDQIEKFKKKQSYAFHYVHLENLEELNIQALPTTYIFNAEGELKFSEAGSRNWDSPSSLELITQIMNDNEK
ncbi:MAG: TlpA family protein disulfide reductase [Bacteroidia bacterium]|nr:TlpA family protein disulfide reductase [Bacteroidia bacterium]